MRAVTTTPSLHHDRHRLALAALLFISSRLKQVTRPAALLSLAFAIFIISPAPRATAAKLGGAYFVDDAEIGKLGSCEIESWGSFAANTDRIFVFSPACVFNVGRPVELGASYIKIRSDGAWESTLALTAKTVAVPISGSSMGLALAGAVLYDLDNNTINGLIVNAPLTWDISQQVRFNVNVGAIYDIDRRELFATTGAGISWNFVKQWSWISEVFAVLGPAQTNPRYQSGIRYNPTKDIDLDLIYGRNLTGEGANWMTLALTVRINDD